MMFFDFLNYYLKAGNAHSIHSPFIFDLYTKVYRDFSANPDFETLEKRRSALKNDPRLIRIEDMGAGSRRNASSERTVGDIARKSLQSPFWCRFFYRLIRHYGHKNILELGTSLGVTTSYLSLAAPDGKVWTLEGCENTLKVARDHFESLRLQNVFPVNGNIDLLLEDTLDKTGPLDFVLFDANHSYQPTLDYFNLCYTRAGENTVFVLDDLYWSDGMKKAWKEICADPRVSLSADFFHIGLVFFRKGVEKQHFVLK
ncbi:MAG: class I SAM-dependent methyltransferase [Leadbetterella sp.]|nr:class I SAM-dependent methyltransferase [Leadbetterella sp.]